MICLIRKKENREGKKSSKFELKEKIKEMINFNFFLEVSFFLFFYFPFSLIKQKKNSSLFVFFFLYIFSPIKHELNGTVHNF